MANDSHGNALGGIGAPNEVVLSFPLMAKNLDIKIYHKFIM
ncbi:hypothetical protein [Parageobacillus thermoglucosidasius]|nr:hypothetical protein [Parageobacillus thermoglucosidasius]MED4912725.1 hypothetical protein [Parageobacillus thermoglucosidasius]MED4945115.1 hypothetical protein [Parageobacillus thermoglucosidasius]MED4982224.1 hypothetical protein [Parageobacillus thermoglucosidasius]